MDWFWTVYAFVIGLCIGSFLNVVVLRGFSGESIVLPPSHCPKCDHKLAWYAENADTAKKKSVSSILSWSFLPG